MDVRQSVVNELHKPARKNFKRRRTVIKGLNDLFQADLVEMIPYASVNKGYRYILMVLNAFSKMLWVKPVKRKTGEDVTKAMKQILLEAKVAPKNLHTDEGKEFFNKYFKQLMARNKINHYTTFSSPKASLVERCNRTIKNMLWKEFSLQGNYKWLSILDKIVDKYNKTKHTTTGFKPISVSKLNEKKILETVYNRPEPVNVKKAKFAIDDPVRISKYRSVFKKSYTPNWSTEVFKVRKILPTSPRMYSLVDEQGNNIKGGFYETELQKVKYPDVYLVEKVLKRRGNMIFVKWLGMDKVHNSWIKKDSII